MAKDKRAWRKLAKKLRRSKIRIAKALSLIAAGQKSTVAENLDSDKSLNGKANKATRFSDSMENATTLVNENDDILHRLEEAAWLERERQAQLEFKMKCAENEKREMTRAAEEVVCSFFFCRYCHNHYHFVCVYDLS